MKKTPLRRVSKKRQKQLREYSVLREQYLETHRGCAVCGERRATEIHHMAQRRGEMLNDPVWFLAVCRECHTDIHARPSWARQKGYLI